LANFSIGFTGFDEDDPLVALGELRLGEVHEYFQSVLGFWELGDYTKSWAIGLRRILAGASISCLATSVTDPATANFIETWPLYREGADVYVHNKYLFLDQLTSEFDPTAPWGSIGPRSVVNEDGQRISEWKVRLDDIRYFLDSGALSDRT
jgi:CdiI N-terminal domain